MHASCCSVGAGMAPDEFIFITALKHWGYVRSVRRVDLKPGMRFRPGTLLNGYPTFVVFPAESSPHPVLWTQLEGKVMCQVCFSWQAAGACRGSACIMQVVFCSASCGSKQHSTQLRFGRSLWGPGHV